MAKNHKAMRKFLEEMGLEIRHSRGKLKLIQRRASGWGMIDATYHGNGEVRVYEPQENMSGVVSSMKEAFHRIRDIRHYLYIKTFPSIQEYEKSLKK